MSIPYSTQLFAGQIPNTGITDLFTAPTGQTTVVRDIEVINPGTTPSSAHFGIIGIGFFLALPNVPAGEGSQWKGRVVLQSGQVFACNWLGESVLELVTSGYVLHS